MLKRYVLDGPPGSGKSTLLFGLSDGAGQGGSPYTLSGLGYACIHESVAETHAILSGKGIDYTHDKEAWLATIVELDRDKFHVAKDGDGPVFYDRCFHHWQLLSEVSRIPLPDWYEEENDRIRYDGPVFLVAPVKSMNLDDPNIHESRRFSWEERQAVYDKTRALYRNLGYEVVEIPVFIEGDIDQNNRKRIARILEYVA